MRFTKTMKETGNFLSWDTLDGVSTEANISTGLGFYMDSLDRQIFEGLEEDQTLTVGNMEYHRE